MSTNKTKDIKFTSATKFEIGANMNLTTFRQYAATLEYTPSLNMKTNSNWVHDNLRVVLEVGQYCRLLWSL